MAGKPAQGERDVPDIVGPHLAVLFCGINPGLTSGSLGQHFARPGNRFWKVLHAAGFTDRVLSPAEQRLLLGYRLGITNLVDRTTRAGADVSPAELAEGAWRLTRKVERLKPSWLAVLGVVAYRRAFGRPRAGIGRQPETIGSTGIWVLPNPSGLQARYQFPEMVELFAELRAASGHCAGAGLSSPPPCGKAMGENGPEPGRPPGAPAADAPVPEQGGQR